MEFLVGDKMKELEVIGLSGIEMTEDFIRLGTLLKEGVVWEDDENLCMSEASYEYYAGLARKQNNVFALLRYLDVSLYQEYFDYYAHFLSLGKSYYEIVDLLEGWLERKAGRYYDV